MDWRRTLKLSLEKRAPGAMTVGRRLRALLWNALSNSVRTFRRIYLTNEWGNTESRSGPGSASAATRSLRRSLPVLFAELGVRSIVDAPCGDFWFRHVDVELDSYLGIDVVQELVERNQREYGSSKRAFVKMDLTREVPPRADLVLCRDLLIHLSYEHGRRVLRNFARSNSSWLLCSDFPEVPNTHDIPMGRWRAINLRAPPFGFPEPERVLEDDPPAGLSSGEAPRRTMGLWRLSDLPLY